MSASGSPRYLRPSDGSLAAPRARIYPVAAPASTPRSKFNRGCAAPTAVPHVEPVLLDELCNLICKGVELSIVIPSVTYHSPNTNNIGLLRCSLSSSVFSSNLVGAWPTKIYGVPNEKALRKIIAWRK